MAPRRNKGKGGTSIGLVLFVLLIGFVLGVYLSPKITELAPEELHTRFGIKKVESTNQEKSVNKKSTRETGITEAPKNIYSLEVAVFSDMQGASGLVDTLNTRGYFPDIQTGKGIDGVIYKVRMGLWTSKEDAVDFARNFETKEEMKVTVVEVE